MSRTSLISPIRQTDSNALRGELENSYSFLTMIQRCTLIPSTLAVSRQIAWLIITLKGGLILR